MWDLTPACADVQIKNRDLAEVEVTPRRRKVAIVGFASNTLHLVPWDNPEFEIWGMNQAYQHSPRRCDRWFEMHLMEAMPDARDPNYLEFLRTCTIPIYMIERMEQFPTSIRYPIEDAIQYAGRDYFMSSIAFMLALVGMEGFEEVHLYGINLAIGDEYFYEKPNAEWWIGKLEGKGITVFVPQASALLKQYRRYGYFVDARPQEHWKSLLAGRAAEYRARAERTSNDLHIVLGALREVEALAQVAEGMDHGADIVLMPTLPTT